MACTGCGVVSSDLPSVIPWTLQVTLPKALQGIVASRETDVLLKPLPVKPTLKPIGEALPQRSEIGLGARFTPPG